MTVSSKFQIVIPKSIREEFGVAAGQKIQLLAYDGRIILMPERSPRELRGFVEGIDTSVPRDADRV